MWGTEDLVGVSQKQSSVATVGKIDISQENFILFIQDKLKR